MTEPGNGGQTPGMQRWVKIALSLSLAVNLLVAGLVLGAAIGGPAGGGADGRGPGGPGQRGVNRGGLRDIGPAPYFAALSQQQRQTLNNAVAGHDSDLRSNREAMRAGFEDILVIVRAEPFDATALASRLQALGDTTQARSRLGEALLVEQLSAMTPAARADYADRLDASVNRPPRRP